MKVLAIDPGPQESAAVIYDAVVRQPLKWSKTLNAHLLDALDYTDADDLAIEMVASYGMAVGVTVFETCVWSGRFIERWMTPSLSGSVFITGSPPAFSRAEPRRIYRCDVKLHLCGSARAKDSNIRQALIDRYGPGKEKAVGRKASPGPLYGMKADCWAALGVAITAVETPA